MKKIKQATSALNRAILEEALGKTVRKQDWDYIEFSFKDSGIEFTFENLHLLAKIKKAVPGKIDSENLKIIYSAYSESKNLKLRGITIWNAVVRILHRKHDRLPSTATLYKWFTKTSVRGYKAMQQIYTSVDLAIVVCYALKFKPDF